MNTLTQLHRTADRALGNVILLERTRNGEGQFAPQQPPGMDAMTMRTAYDPRNNAHRQSTVAKVAKVAAVGAGLVGVGVLSHRAGSASGYQRGAVAAGKKWKSKPSRAPKETDGFAKKVSDAITKRRTLPEP